MHEFSIAHSLLEIVDQEALPYTGARVTRIKVLIGELSGVMPEALRFAFEALNKGGIAEGSMLEIEEVPLSLRCSRCGKTSVAENPFLLCPLCESAEVEIIAGRELEIAEMEIEDGN